MLRSVSMCALVLCALVMPEQSTRADEPRGTAGAPDVPAAAAKPQSLELTYESIDGVQYTRSSPSQSRATVFVFISTTCPIANAYQPRLRELQKEFAGHGIGFVQVVADPNATKEKLEQHRREYDIQSVLVLDQEQRLARALTAKVTPEAIVVDGRGYVRYRGRIDNQYATFGKKRPSPTVEDLKIVLDALIHNRVIETVETTAVGCRIQYAESGGGVSPDTTCP